MSDTIVAISTAVGVASISIVRVSGRDALDVALLVAPKAKFKLKPREAILTPLFDKYGNLIDRAIVIYFKAPRSFTGEDIVEFQCHGGAVIAEEIVQSAISAGARIANPGEFSKRAFLNGKIDLSEAEAIAKIIEAKSKDAVKILAKQLKGELGKFVDGARDELLTALAYSEVMIDYAEEDIPEDILESIEDKLLSLNKKLSEIVEGSIRRMGLLEGFKLSIIGKPNVGKSSLLNSILNYERAIVSSTAGTTRDTIEESIRVGSHIIRVVDTAGIRDTEDEVERIGVERSLSSTDDADIVVALFDSSQELGREDEEIVKIVERLKLKGKEIIVVLSKGDIAKEKIDREVINRFSPITIDRNSIKPLLERLEETLDSFGVGVEEELVLSSSRQIEAVKSSLESVDGALEPLRRGELELFSYHLQEAISTLSQITNPYKNEEILDKMFSQFCLGK
jgi:tRNA modification GTPase